MNVYIVWTANAEAGNTEETRIRKSFLAVRRLALFHINTIKQSLTGNWKRLNSKLKACMVSKEHHLLSWHLWCRMTMNLIN